MNEFDVRTFIDNLRATKPPYECPFEECGRIYKSFSGIQSHLSNFKHNEKSEPKFGLTSNRVLTRESLTYLQAQKIVDFELDGKPMRINIYEPLEIVTTLDGDDDDKRSPKEILQKHKEIRSPVSPRSKAPEATFRIIDEFCPDETPPLPSSYIKYIERTDDADEQVEYDMDEEDYVWLSLINEKRIKSGLPRVSENTLELLMDCFEKESHFQAATNDQQQLFDDDAVCCVCNDGECDNSNAILFCDMCNLAVHQECYGVPYIPEGQWLCRRCQLSPSQAVDCVLCPNRGGAFKQTSDGRWAHVVCALWVPEVQFANTVFLEPIEGFERLPKARWNLNCYICKQKKNAGACIQCHKPTCYTAFHVTCAQSAGLYMKIEPVKDLSPGGSSYTVRKTAFCDAHAPMKDEDSNNGGVENDDKVHSDRREESKLKMRRARKILAQRRNSSPLISVPVISRSRLEAIAAQLKFAGKQNFLERLLGYWTLKRQSRFGVPLLRRLQVNSQTKRTIDKEQQTLQLPTQLRYWKRLRQDLEKARLLVELIRKREQKKKEIITVAANISETLLTPAKNFLVETIDKLLAKDDGNVFAKPVTEEEVPGYHRFVKNPIDLGTMRQKALNGDYFDVNDVQNDFNLMINNCLAFNKKNPYFLKYAQKMKRLGGQVLKEALDSYSEINNSSAINLPQLITSVASPSVSAKSEEKSPKLKKEISRKRSKLNPNRVKRPKLQEIVALVAQSPKLPPVVERAESSDDEDSRPLSALVIDESRKDLTGGEETSSQTSPYTRKKRKSVKKPKNSHENSKEFQEKSVSGVASPSKSSESQNKTQILNRSSFRTFRGNLNDPMSPNECKSESGNDYGSSTEKDDTDCESAPHVAEGFSCSVTEASAGAGHLPLQHLDMVWATPSDYPFPFPGVIVDPQAPVFDQQLKPPENIVKKQNFSDFRYLVMIFGENSTWRWVESKNVEPLFIDSSLDRRKLAIPSKSSDKKSLQKAYDAAVSFRCKNTGEDPQDFSVDRGDASDASSSCE